MTLTDPATAELEVTPYDYSAVKDDGGNTFKQYITYTLAPKAAATDGSSDAESIPFPITKDKISRIAKKTDDGIVMYKLDGTGTNVIEILDSVSAAPQGSDKKHQAGWTLKRSDADATQVWYFWAKGANGSADTVYKATFEVPQAISNLSAAFGDTVINVPSGSTWKDVVNKAPSDRKSVV